MEGTTDRDTNKNSGEETNNRAGREFQKQSDTDTKKELSRQTESDREMNTAETERQLDKEVRRHITLDGESYRQTQKDAEGQTDRKPCSSQRNDVTAIDMRYFNHRLVERGRMEKRAGDRDV